MTKFITILISCSLTLAVGVRAEQEDPNKKHDKSKAVQKQQVAPKQHTNTHVQSTHVQRVDTHHKDPTLRSVKVPENNTVKFHDNSTVKIHENAKIHDNTVLKPQVNTLPAVQSNKPNKWTTDKLNKTTVQSFHPQHQNFHAQQKSAVASVTFNQNFHIHGAQNWNGPHYQVYKSYHPQWHDQGWWHSHHNHLTLISGGWYYWDGGYWYPAWGYDNSAAYYPYDGPVYSGPSATPLDQVIADVQSALQEQGYYHGEVDGLLGPLTRQALADFQRAQGLYATETIDQPTLAALGLAG
jgi:hypothetical protein